jgi:hypothetical protein
LKFEDDINKDDDSDGDPVLDVINTFKKYVSEKKFNEDDKALVFKDYYKLNFPNDVPEIVCDIICYLSHYYHYRTGYVKKKVYEHLLDS